MLKKIDTYCIAMYRYKIMVKWKIVASCHNWEEVTSKWISTFFFTGYDDVPPFVFPPDVDGKVIHLVERAPPLATMSGFVGAGASARGLEGGSSSSHTSTSSESAPHDGNSYVMLGTFNLPVNIIDPQQIQVGMTLLHARETFTIFFWREEQFHAVWLLIFVW